MSELLASKFYREGRFDDAKQHYLKLPKSAGVLMRLGEIALWENKANEAERYFKEAQSQTSWLGKRWPLSAQLNTSLATTYYRQDRFAEASRYFKQSAGPGILMPFRYMKSVAAQLDRFKGHAPYHIEGQTSTRIPFDQTDPLPVLQVSVNGSPSIPFFIDTGGSELILDTAFATSAGAARVSTIPGGGGGTQGAIGLGKVDRVTLGDINVHHVPVHIMEMGHFAAVFDGLPVKGIIGTRLLMHFLATIDYVNGCLILQPKTTFVETQGAHAIPFWLIQAHYMVASGTINGSEPLLFFVDTGLAGIGFSAEEALLQKAGIAVDWSKAESGIAAFGSTDTFAINADRVTLGNAAAENVPGVAFKRRFEILGYTLGFHVGGVVSHQFFRPYTLTLDFVGMRLILKS